LPNSTQKNADLAIYLETSRKLIFDKTLLLSVIPRENRSAAAIIPKLLLIQDIPITSIWLSIFQDKRGSHRDRRA